MFFSLLLLVLVHAVPSLAVGLPADVVRLPAALDRVSADLRRVPANLAARAPAMADLFMADSASASPTPRGRTRCTVDVCQPVVVVAVAGFEPRWDVRGRRTEFLLSMLSRLDLGAPASVARWVALTGVTVDYRMPDRTQGFQLNVSMRWRMSAFGGLLAWTE